MKAVDGVKNLYKHVKPLKHGDITSTGTKHGGVVLSKTVKVFDFFVIEHFWKFKLANREYENRVLSVIS